MGAYLGLRMALPQEYLAGAQAAEVAEHFKQRLPEGVKVLVVGEGIQVSVVAETRDDLMDLPRNPALSSPAG